MGLLQRELKVPSLSAPVSVLGHRVDALGSGTFGGDRTTAHKFGHWAVRSNLACQFQAAREPPLVLEWQLVLAFGPPGKVHRGLLEA